MDNKIITISREFGSGGRIIGEELAKHLGISFYDKEIIARVAEQTGLATDFIEKNGEYSPSKSMFAYGWIARNSMGESLEDYLYSVQRKIILEIAEHESCVIVGRCADAILRNYPKCLNVFIYSDEEHKAEKIYKVHGKTGTEAKRMMRDMDKKRSINYNYYTDRKWGAVHNYTMALNSGDLGYEKCIKLIAEAAENL